MKKSNVNFVLAVSVFTLSFVITFAAVQAAEQSCKVCRESNTEFFCAAGQAGEVVLPHVTVSGTWITTAKKRECKLGAGTCDPEGGHRQCTLVSAGGSQVAHNFPCCP